MNIIEYAEINGISPEEFVNEISAAFASLMSMEFDKSEENVVKMSYKFESHKVNIIVTREDFN